MNEADDRTDRYHHGALRQALLSEGVRLLETGGREAVSLRALARAAGVTPSAVYRHFDSAQALLAGIAAQGFRDLGAALDAASHAVPAQDRVRALGRAYIGFARARPAMFAVMFDPALAAEPAVTAEGRVAFDQLRKALAAAEPTQDAGTVETKALRNWALVHGWAVLAQGGWTPDLDILEDGPVG